MDKSESKDLGASKRPSARRAGGDSELPAGETMAPSAKRVHARRAALEQERHAREAGVLDVSAAQPAEIGIELGASAAPAAESSNVAGEPPARARARRPRASLSKAPRRHAADIVPPTAAADAPSRPSETRELAGASLVERASWPARLTRTDDIPAPSLDHADFADDFGLDAEYETKLRPWLETLCERHFHLELYGAENIPTHGRAMLVANHSRASVWDGIVLRAALRSQHPAKRVPRWLVDDQQFHAPFLGTFVNRLGAVRACQENAERLLLREELVAVFPEGSKATDRPYEERYRLQRFGRGGYVKLALRTGTPVIPVAIVATEHEGAVWRNRLANASRVLAAPFAALRPGIPRMGRLGVPPISARIRIYVGAPVAEISKHDAAVTQDDSLVHELNECVRSAVQSLVNASLHA
ncbi:MAG TPA: lysophospholipid acyltransferase family protein [Polyangiales bacterium]|nr:lysophospholipid acyltransferase family protein [Polyangiales bacterium]